MCYIVWEDILNSFKILKLFTTILLLDYDQILSMILHTFGPRVLCQFFVLFFDSKSS